MGSAFAMYGLRYVWQSKLYGAAIGITRVMRGSYFISSRVYHHRFILAVVLATYMAHATNDLNAVEEATGMGIMTATH